MTAKDNWHYSFDNLPKYDENGDEYLYTVKEWKVPGYITGVDGDDNITNTLATSISGNKIWVDNDNAAGKRPSSIKVDLYQNGVQIDSKKVSGEGNEWPYNFANLPKYDADGKEYVYTVKEETVPGYTQTQNGLEITNTIEPEVTPEPETTAVSGTKTWIDNDDAGKTRPDSINVHLYQNGELFKSQTVTAANNWQYSFTDLPKYDENGAEYEYTIGEDAVPGYTSDREGDNLTNTLEETTTEPEKTEIKGTKTWVGDDENNRPSSITIDLYRDGQKIDSKQVTAADNWAYSFTDLDKDDGNGHEYVYSVKEADVPDDYTSEQIGTDFVNTYIAKETTEISGTKIWQDNNNATNSRPDSVTVMLYRNGEATTQTQTVTAANNWQYHFTDLAKYDENGKPYVYLVKETDVPNNYQVTYSGFDIVNTLKKTSIAGTKTWVDDNNAANKRPASVTFELYRNGKKTGQTATATAATNWRYQFTGLAKLDKLGKEYTYTFKEVAVPGYTTSQNGHDFTNTLDKETTDEDNNGSGEEDNGSGDENHGSEDNHETDHHEDQQNQKDSNKQKLPQAGEQHSSNLLIVAGFVLLLTTIFSLAKIGFKKEN
ncbi:Cna B-type domain-containing protein [Lapidilactobacillus gannanensis]|uniref:Cna B-type domain-containing protein n=1 Tax=Lapidilactobacillus gannanensis TaxID=2486002 RepID=UPI001CDBD4A3|nr:Cna B-type domain-containing protein [Lapidilactobacillus gannanensis]